MAWSTLSLIRRRVYLAFGFVLALLAMSLTFSACTQKDEDGNLVVLYPTLRDDIKTWDPANVADTVSNTVAPLVYEALYQYDFLSETYKLIPLLAADMPQYSKDRLTVTIPIKRGIRFQDDKCFKQTQGKGRELKAQDFIYGFKRLALPALQSQGWWVFDGKIKGINEFHDKLIKASKADLPKVFAQEIEGARALDDYTIQLKLNAPYPQLMYVLAMGFTSPVPHEAIDAYADENGNLTDHPVGTGPFVLTRWDRGRQIVLDKNPNFHPDFYPTDGAQEFQGKGFLEDSGKQLPFLNRLVFKIIIEQQPGWLNFLKGKVDIFRIPKDNFSQAITNKSNLTPEFAAKGYRLNMETGVGFYFISFNMRDRLLGGNKYLRQALSAAINRDQWIETFTNGTGIKMTTPLPPGLRDRVEDGKVKYDYNVALAKELLKKAGYPEGQGLPVLNFDLRGSASLDRQYGEFFAQQWGAIGVKVNVTLNTFPAYIEKLTQGNLQVSYGGWSIDYPDAENVYQLFYGPNKAPGPNNTNYDNPEVNKLFQKMAALEPGPARAAVLRKIDEIIQEDVPWALGYYHSQYELSQPWVMNYRTNDVIGNRYKYIRVNKDIKKRYLSFQ